MTTFQIENTNMFRFEKFNVWQKAIDFADFARFVQIAYGSLMEVVSQAVIAKNQGFMADDRCREIYTDAEELARMLSGLKARLLR